MCPSVLQVLASSMCLNKWLLINYTAADLTYSFTVPPASNEHHRFCVLYAIGCEDAMLHAADQHCLDSMEILTG